MEREERRAFNSCCECIPTTKIVHPSWVDGALSDCWNHVKSPPFSRLTGSFTRENGGSIWEGVAAFLCLDCAQSGIRSFSVKMRHIEEKSKTLPRDRPQNWLVNVGGVGVPCTALYAPQSIVNSFSLRRPTFLLAERTTERKRRRRSKRLPCSLN